LFWLCLASACQRSHADLQGHVGGSASAVRLPSLTTDAAESSARALCEALHAVAAERKALCCGRAPERLLLDECTRAVGRSLGAGALSSNDAGVAACRAAMQEAVTGCDWVTPGPAPSVAACGGLLTGQLGEGANCRSSLECRAPLHCDGVGATQSGTCQAPRELGAACGAVVDPLAAYALEHELDVLHPLCRDFCSLLSHRCEATPRAGDSCVASVNCARGQHCVAGRCSDAEARTAGESCADAACGVGLRCENRRCVPLARAGEACRSDFECREGGCVVTNAGSSVCGMQCNVSLDALRRPTTPAMRLPLRPRPEGPSENASATRSR